MVYKSVNKIKEKKLNVSTCRQCGRRFINLSTLSKSIQLEDYCLTPVKSEDW